MFGKINIYSKYIRIICNKYKYANIIILGDYILNFDEILYIKKIGAGARVKFKGTISIGKDLVREDILAIDYIPEGDWEKLKEVIK